MGIFQMNICKMELSKKARVKLTDHAVNKDFPDQSR